MRSNRYGTTTVRTIERRIFIREMRSTTVHWRVVLVAGLVSIAGCSVFGSGDQSQQTVTPAPVIEPTEPNATQGETRLSSEEVQNPRLLAEAHVRAIRGMSYTWRDRYIEVRTGENISKRSVTRRRARVETETTYTYWTNRWQTTTRNPFRFYGKYTEYATEQARYARYVENGALAHEQFPPRTAATRIGGMAKSSIRRYLAVENSSVRPVQIRSDEYYRITGTGYTGPDDGTVRNYSVEALVSRDGFVISLSVSFVRVQNYQREEVTYEFGYDWIGLTSVDRPTWVKDHWPSTDDETATPWS